MPTWICEVWRATAGAPFDELLQLYVLEAFLARLAGSRFADQFVLKGWILLAAFDERRPTRDIDLQGQVTGIGLAEPIWGKV